jgi:sulfur relay (sulfurtransferase) DsrF/TusC family protein
MNMVRSILTIIKSAPYGREDAFAGLRFSLSQIAAGMLDACDTLLIEDGIYNAKLNQDTAAIRMPSNLEATEDLLDLDGRVFVVREDMESRFLRPEDLLEGVEIFSIADLPGMVEAYDAFATY